MNRKHGVISLGLLIVIAVVVTEISMAGALLTSFLTSANLNERIAAETLAAAQSGVADGLMRVMYGTFVPETSYSLTVDAAHNLAANVSICYLGAGGCQSFVVPRVQITSSGTNGIKSRKLVAVASLDLVTRVVTVESITEELL